MSTEMSDRIRAARKSAGLSREKLAGELGVSLSTVVRLETGRTKRVSVEMLQAVARATGQPLAYFITDKAAA